MNIVITGASRGIGYATVKEFNKNLSHRIVAIARDKEGLDQLKKECTHPENVYTLVFDLRGDTYESIRTFVLEHLESVDILINNAGVILKKVIQDVSYEEMKDVFDVNFFAPARMIQTLFDIFVSGSHIVNIGSMGGVTGTYKFDGFSMYSASKAALGTLTECLAEELKTKHISVNCLALGAVQTEMFEKVFPNEKAPLQASDIAPYIVHFAETGNSIMNGKVIPAAISTP